ncbi:MAG: hypothetical protein CXT73_06830 [Methanobacteriota archaeon]|nr:MAG: hypothetical protein CXT73_06830 [Euryarchaeota archaeon]
MVNGLTNATDQLTAAFLVGIGVTSSLIIATGLRGLHATSDWRDAASWAIAGSILMSRYAYTGKYWFS